MSNKKKITAIIILFLITILFFLKLGIDPLIFSYSIDRFFTGTIKYEDARLGTLMLTSSLVGLGIILSIYASFITKSKTKNLGSIWIFSTYSFILSIFFSLIKILVGYPEEKRITSQMIDGIGHLSFVYFTIGVFALISWILVLEYRLKRAK